MTNYEKYFSDIAPLNEVKRAMINACVAHSCDCLNCPFSMWGRAFGVCNPACGGFIYWLYEEARI